MMLTDGLAHLQTTKHRELERAAEILFDEFEDALKTKLSDKGRRGRILKLILFGENARSGRLGDQERACSSNFELLIVVNYNGYAEQHEAWEKARQRFFQEVAITRRLSTPVNFIVHTYHDLNIQLSQGRPFFVDIIQRGIVLYEMPGFPLASPKIVSPKEIRHEAIRFFDYWFPISQRRYHLAQLALEQGYRAEAAFELHQATECAYHSVLLALTLHSPKSHRLALLRSHAERVSPMLMDVWPRNDRIGERCFMRLLDRAYVDARYSPEYKVSDEELSWLFARIKNLQNAVAAICHEHFDIETSSAIPD